MMTRKRLKRLVKYKKHTGIFILRKDKTPIGSLNSDGYLTLWVNNKNVYLHRLAWLYHYGYEPDIIDHINGVRTDNSIKNLRNVSNGDNSRNMKRFKTNKSGQTGVCWNSALSNWRAYIHVDNQRVNLGSFVKFSDAVDARKNAEVLYGYHKNHGRT